MKKILITIYIITFGLISCEETVKNPELLYQEQLVIAGILGHNQSNPSIQISKTLHPLDYFDYEKAIIKNAEATLYDGNNEYPLKYIDNKKKYFIENFTPEIGKSYSLTVKWNNSVINASTYIPDTCKFIKFEYEINESKEKDWYGYFYYVYTLNIYTIVTPAPNAVFTGVSNLYGNQFSHDYTTECYRYEDRNTDGNLKIKIIEQSYTFEQKLSQEKIYQYIFKDLFEYHNDLTVRIYSWHPDYYKFFNTRFNGDMNDFIFGTSGNNVQGNIKNAIGFFYGYSFISRKLELTQ